MEQDQKPQQSNTKNEYELRRQKKLEQQQQAIRRRTIKKITTYAVITVIIGSIVWLLIAQSQKNEGLVLDVAKTCVQHGRLGMHIHPVLRIVINGRDEIIPANTGISSPACMRPLHTHDTTGTIHIESKEIRDFQLKEFFAVWGKSFSHEQILDYKVDEKHQIRVTINGIETDQFENLVMRDKDQIVIYYDEVGTTN